MYSVTPFFPSSWASTDIEGAHVFEQLGLVVVPDSGLDKVEWPHSVVGGASQEHILHRHIACTVCREISRPCSAATVDMSDSLQPFTEPLCHMMVPFFFCLVALPASISLSNHLSILNEIQMQKHRKPSTQDGR